MEHTFVHETSRDDDGSLRVRAAPDGDVDEAQRSWQAVSHLDARYPIDFIDAFLKSLPVTMIVAYVQQDNPLMMVHRLGGGIPATGGGGIESQIRFLIAPRLEVD